MHGCRHPVPLPAEDPAAAAHRVGLAVEAEFLLVVLAAEVAAVLPAFLVVVEVEADLLAARTAALGPRLLLAHGRRSAWTRGHGEPTAAPTRTLRGVSKCNRKRRRKAPNHVIVVQTLPRLVSSHDDQTGPRAAQPREGDEAVVDHLVQGGEDRVDPLGRIDALDHERQVLGELQDAIGVNPRVRAEALGAGEIDVAVRLRARLADPDAASGVVCDVVLCANHVAWYKRIDNDPCVLVATVEEAQLRAVRAAVSSTCSPTCLESPYVSCGSGVFGPCGRTFKMGPLPT